MHNVRTIFCTRFVLTVSFLRDNKIIQLNQLLKQKLYFVDLASFKSFNIKWKNQEFKVIFKTKGRLIQNKGNIVYFLNQFQRSKNEIH